jgi:3,4-dihydroxy 2-butanone 4-phosphate synthase / GTP cyclohydrolase II
MNDDGTMARLPDLLPFAAQHGLKIGTIADLIHYRSAHESLIERVGARSVQTAAGRFDMVAYRDRPSGGAHLALVLGAPDPENETLVRVHEPLSVLDLIDTERSRHSWPVHHALQVIAQSALWSTRHAQLRRHARPWCSKSSKRLSRAGSNGDAEAARATKMDLRTYGVGAQILRDLNVGKMKLLAKPRKMPSMTGFGLHVTGYLEG